MPTDVYLGTAIGVIILVLVVSLFWPRRAKRQVVQKPSGPDPVAVQLSRIADALEALTAHVESPLLPLQKAVQKAPALSHPPAQQVSEPLFQNIEPPSAVVQQPPAPALEPVSAPAPELAQVASEPTPTEPTPAEPAAPRRIKLSMFGR